MSSDNCLNCGKGIEGKFCSNCGQKSNTHQITVTHFLQHELFHGVFHIDKGILFTIKETFSRPGAAAIDYIKGKRIAYYNIFYLLLILIGLNALLIHFSEILHDKKQILIAENDGVKFYEFFKTNIKVIILSFIPLFALNGMFVFKRAKLNFAEQHIVSGFTLLGCTLLALIINLFGLLPDYLISSFVGWIQMFIFITLLLFPLYTYFQAFYNLYKPFGFIWRALTMYMLFLIQAIIIVFVLLLVVSGGHFDGSLQLQ